jgi:hypothetical protein
MSKSRKRVRGPDFYRESDLGGGVVMRWRALPCSDGECEEWGWHPHGYVAMGGHDRWVPVVRSLIGGDEDVLERAAATTKLAEPYAKLLMAFGVPWEKLWDPGLAAAQAWHIFEMSHGVNAELNAESLQDLSTLTMATPHSRFQSVRSLLLLMRDAHHAAAVSDTYLPERADSPW